MDILGPIWPDKKCKSRDDITDHFEGDKDFSRCGLQTSEYLRLLFTYFDEKHELCTKIEFLNLGSSVRFFFSRQIYFSCTIQMRIRLLSHQDGLGLMTLLVPCVLCIPQC